jgi:hypothetical protein
MTLPIAFFSFEEYYLYVNLKCVFKEDEIWMGKYIYLYLLQLEIIPP